LKAWVPFEKFSEMDAVFWRYLFARDVSLKHFMKKGKRELMLPSVTGFFLAISSSFD
jgi:hypothetical protein